MNWNNVFFGALSGVAAAVMVDLDAWKSGTIGAEFDWSKAGRRYLYGAISGALAALGLNALPQPSLGNI